MSNDKTEATFYGESRAQQRERIIRSNIGTPGFVVSDFDDAVALGYEPESWHGMWKLPAPGEWPWQWPILWISRNWAIVTEIVYHPGTIRPIRTRSGRNKTRRVLRRRIR